jgi:hypothetical protein
VNKANKRAEVFSGRAKPIRGTERRKRRLPSSSPPYSYASSKEDRME